MAEGFALYEMLYDEHDRPVDWRILEVNDAYRINTGITPDRVVGLRVSEVFPETIPEYIGRFASVIATQTSSVFETYAKAMGKYQRVITFPAGERRFASTVLDITERKRIEDALRASEEKFARVFQFFPDPLVITRAADNIILEINDAAERLTGISRSEIIGRMWSELRLIPVAEEQQKLAELFRATGQVTDYELEFTANGGEASALLVGHLARLLPFAVTLNGVTTQVTAPRATSEGSLCRDEMLH